MSKFDVALAEIQKGFSVLPLYSLTKDNICTCKKGAKCITPGKHPWLKGWQNDATNNPEVAKEWWDKYPNSNVGVATGEKSGIVVVDLDSDKGIQEYKELTGIEDIENHTYTVKTARGFHLYYKSDTYPNRKDLLEDMEVQGNGAYVVAPGSDHHTGIVYSVVSNRDVSELPEAILEAVKTEKPERLNNEDWKATLPKTTRNIQLTRRIGALIKMGIDPLEVFIMAMALNETKCDPPLEAEEVKRIVKSVYKRHQERQEKSKQDQEKEIEEEILSAIDTSEFFNQFSGKEKGWLIKDWFPANNLAFCVSPPGNYKTWMLLALALAVATGNPFLGLEEFPVEDKGAVLFVQQEDDFGMLADRLLMMIKCAGGYYDEDEMEMVFEPVKVPEIYWHIEREIHFSDKKSLKRLENIIKKKNIKLVIIDPLYTAAGTEDFMAAAAEQMLILKKFRDKYNVSFMIAHHTTNKTTNEGRKRDGMWGSIFIKALLETGWQMRLLGGEKGNQIITIDRHFKSYPNPDEINLLMKITETEFIPRVIKESIDMQSENTGAIGDTKYKKSRNLLDEVDFMDQPINPYPIKLDDEHRQVYNLIYNNRSATISDMLVLLGWESGYRSKLHRIIKRLETGGIIFRRGGSNYVFREETLVYDENEHNKAKYQEFLAVLEQLKPIESPILERTPPEGYVDPSTEGERTMVNYD